MAVAVVAAGRAGVPSLWVGGPGLVVGGVLWAPAGLVWGEGVGAAEAVAEALEGPPVDEGGVAVVAGTSSAKVRSGGLSEFVACHMLISPESFWFWHGCFSLFFFCKIGP